jgi:hypothetical protein
VIEKDFGVPFIADLALREKQIQQNIVRSFRSTNGLPGGPARCSGESGKRIKQQDTSHDPQPVRFPQRPD